MILVPMQVDLASIGAAVESMSEAILPALVRPSRVRQRQELHLDREETEWVVSGAKGHSVAMTLACSNYTFEVAPFSAACSAER